MDFSSMSKVIKVNVDDMDCIVQPGISYLDLNEYLQQFGVWLSVCICSFLQISAS
jgi:D-lactate dehydrogenase (cytochrome)